MTRLLALVTTAFALIALATLIATGGAPSSAAHALPPGAGIPGGAPVPVALTISYAIIGGGGSQAQDLLTYTSNGNQQVVPLSTSPAVYLVDSGTQWSVQTVLNGSVDNERWITPLAVAGTITMPLTISFTYYHQYLLNLNFNVTNGGIGYSGPLVSYFQEGSSVSSSAPNSVWADASTNYSYGLLLPGSSSTERWIMQTGGTGTVTKPTTATASYFHQFLVTSSYSVVYGGGPAAPVFLSASFKAPLQVTLTSAPQNVWFDAGANYTFSASLAGSAAERWVGTVLVQTQSGTALSMNNNGTVSRAITVTPAYYHQYLVHVSFIYLGGSTSGLTLPAFTYQSFGSNAAVSTNSALWIDAGSQYTIPENICCTTSPSTERWQLNNSTAGTIARATKISSTYFYQYLDSFFYSIVGQQPPAPFTQPVLSYTVAGSTQRLTLLLTPQSVWTDTNSTYSATSIISSTANVRWFSQSAIGTVGGPVPNSSVNIGYDQQYLLTVIGGALQTQWVDAGNSTSFTTPGVFGRSQGTGFRIVSYQFDAGNSLPISPPALMVTIQMSMTGPHTITFQSVTQFQVSLDAGASGALSSISPPTIPGDNNFWYDSESHVQVMLNGVYGRANGVGQRLSSISASTQPVLQVDTLGTVQAFSTTSLESPISVTTVSIPQYEVVLNSAAMGAFASISPHSTFSGDAFWYDSGAPPVTVVLNGAYSRSAGTGLRVSSWEIDSGPVTKVASTGTITIVTKAMTSPHFLNATTVTQYQVTIDKAGASALTSITNPAIPLDTGWYDAASPVGVVMNGAWGRVAGTGTRLSGYSINGGPQVGVSSSGLAVVLNVTKLASPESIAASIVTQYQVVLDSSATASLASMTPTSIPKDNFWFDGGTPVSVSLNGVWGRSSTTGIRLASYSVNQGTPTAVFTSLPVQVLSLAGISGPQSITTKTTSQYRLSSAPVGWYSATNSTLSGDLAGWYDSGTAVKVLYNSSWSQNSGSSRSSVTGYSIDGGVKTNVVRSGTGTLVVAVSMSGAHTITLASVTQYLLTVVGSAKVTATPPSQTGDSYFDSGSKVTLSIPRVWNSSSSLNERDLLVSYSLNGGSATSVPASSSSGSFTTPLVTFTQPQTLVIDSLNQYRVAFQFFDSLGKNQVFPTGVQLGVGNATVFVQGQTAWMTNGTSFSVINVTWEGAGVGPTLPPSYMVKAAPLNVTLETRVYAASLKVVDLLGLPVSGAQVSMTLANGTTLTGTTKGDGTFAVAMVPLGTFTAKVSSFGTSAQIVGSSASAQPVAEGRVAFSLISLAALVAVVAAAGSSGFLLLRKFRHVKSMGRVSEQK